jgi:hypothetical protein
MGQVKGLHTSLGETDDLRIVHYDSIKYATLIPEPNIMMASPDPCDSSFHVQEAVWQVHVCFNAHPPGSSSLPR